MNYELAQQGQEGFFRAADHLSMTRHLDLPEYSRVLKTQVRAILYATVLSSQLVASGQGARVGPSRGTLVLDGGPEASTTVGRRFVELAGGPNAKIVLIPSAAGDKAARDPALLEFFRARLGAACCTILHTNDRSTADRTDFVAPLREATGVWIAGGDPAVLSNTYWGTATEHALRALLERGGVVGGSSAGALIHGSRTPTANPDRAFAFLRGTVIMPHLNRGHARELLVAEIQRSGGLIGLGISENTAAVITGDRLDVVGDGDVLVVDGTSHVLRAGDRFNLKPRQ